MYRFPAKVRPFVRSLCNLMQYANSIETGQWADGRDGVFGHAQNTINAILKELKFDADIRIGNLETNWGGNETWLDDLEIAITEALNPEE